MYGICNYCGHQAETKEAFCHKCHHPWNTFFAKPKDDHQWMQKKGLFERIRRSLPPWVVQHFIASIILMFCLAPLDIIAWIEEVHISRWSGPFLWSALTLFDLISTWYIYRSMRLSLRGYTICRFLVSFNLGGTVIAFVHNYTQVIGHHIFAPAGLYLIIRFTFLSYIAYVIWMNRIERAILRHGSPSS